MRIIYYLDLCYKHCRRFIKRSFFYILFIVLFVIGTFAVQAVASTSPQKPPKPIVTTTTIKPTTTTSTTTTTTTTTTSPLTTTAPPTTQAPQPAVTPSADWVTQCHIWAEQAGIDLPDSAITLMSRESSCSPTVRNPNSSAGGIPQALPWTKMGCPLEYSDEAAVCQLKWMHGYVFSRYGGWDQALAHSNSRGWY